METRINAGHAAALLVLVSLVSWAHLQPVDSDQNALHIRSSAGYCRCALCEGRQLVSQNSI